MFCCRFSFFSSVLLSQMLLQSLLGFTLFKSHLVWKSLITALLINGRVGQIRSVLIFLIFPGFPVSCLPGGDDVCFVFAVSERCPRCCSGALPRPRLFLLSPTRTRIQIHTFSASLSLWRNHVTLAGLPREHHTAPFPPQEKRERTERH